MCGFSKWGNVFALTGSTVLPSRGSQLHCEKQDDGHVGNQSENRLPSRVLHECHDFERYVDQSGEHREPFRPTASLPQAARFE